MRRKQQIQAMQQELALLRQTIDSGKELAALATNAAQQLKKPSIKTVAVQLMRSPRSSWAGPPPSARSALSPRATGFTRPSSRRKWKRRSSPCMPSSTTCRRPWTPWPRPRASSRKRPARGKSTAAEAQRHNAKSSVSKPETEFLSCSFLCCMPLLPLAAGAAIQRNPLSKRKVPIGRSSYRQKWQKSENRRKTGKMVSPNMYSLRQQAARSHQTASSRCCIEC